MTRSVTFFKEPYDLLQRLVDKVRPSLSAKRLSLLCEALERVRQLEWLLIRVHHHVDTHARLMERVLSSPQVPESPGSSSSRLLVPPELHDEIEACKFEAKLHAESFAYLAWRLRKVIRGKDLGLPGLSNFEAPSIRGVRNHLLEHPERHDSGRFSAAWIFGPGAGVKLKVLSNDPRQGAFEDPGLFHSADEFRDALVVALRRSLASVAA